MENNLPAQQPKRQLPKLEELYTDIELAGKQNDLNRLLNCQPKKEWVKDHPSLTKKVKGNNGQDLYVPVQFMPIGIIENLLTSIFIKWRVEIKEAKLIANAGVLVIRLWVLDPITAEWEWQEGVAAVDLQTKAGAGATEFDKLNAFAVMKALPAAESYAIKDAAEKFGRLFGKDLNRAEDAILNYTSLDKKFSETDSIPEELKIVISQADNEGLSTIFKANAEFQANAEFLKLIQERKNQLNGN
jgi:hypothetical protein